MNTAASKLRQALRDPNAFITAPGVYDGLSARIALNVGFDALYMVCTFLSLLTISISEVILTIG